MKRTTTYPDGTISELSGTPEEHAEHDRQLMIKMLELMREDDDPAQSALDEFEAEGEEEDEAEDDAFWDLHSRGARGTS